MCNIRILVALILSGLISGGKVSAQSPSSPDTNGLPGGSYRGKYIGFQPRHGRVPASSPGRQPDQRAAMAVPRAAAELGAPAVSQSNFEDATLAMPPGGPSPPLPPGEVLVDGVDGWDSEPGYDGSTIGGWQDVAEPAVWIRGDYLRWWTKGMSVPELATTSPNGTAQANAGVLGRPGTSVLFGGENLLDDSRSGGRISLGFWLDPCHQSGLEFSYLGLGEESASFRGADDQFSILARPFFDLGAGVADSRLIVFPNLVEGAMAIDVSSEFQTAEVLLCRPRARTCGSNVDIYLGYRFAELEDLVAISEATTSLAEPTTGTRFQLDDRFESRNQFNGALIGVRIAGQTTPGWTTEFSGKVGLGNTSSRMAITGQTVVTPTTGASTTQPAGLLVQGTNTGVFETDDFSTLSEFGLTFRRQIDCGWSFNFGYQVLLWTDVVRAGEQIDTTINVTQIPPGTLSGQARPAFRAETTDFWAQGLSFGLEYSY